MKALVTGATGFIGTNLCHKLVSNKYQVRALIRNSKKAKNLQQMGVENVAGDVTNPQSLEGITKGMDYVFHLAGTLAAKKQNEHVYETVNITGTKNLLAEALKNPPKRFVHVSSVGIYGPTNKYPASETSPHNPYDIYSKTKLAGEKHAWSYSEKGVPLVVVRPTIVYGPFDTGSSILSLFKAIKNNRFFLIGKKDTYFHTLYIDNLTEALILCADTSPPGEDYIIGDVPSPTLHRFAKEIAKAVGTELPTHRVPNLLATIAGRCGDFVESCGIPMPISTARVKFMTSDRIFSTKKAEEMLGYQPKTSLIEGVYKTASWYEKLNLI